MISAIKTFSSPRNIQNVMRKSSSSSLLLRSLSSVSSKQEFLLVNAVGMDRPGIVSDITHQVTKAGGNIGSSQSSKLGSHFGLMMLVSVPQEQSQSLQRTLANMDNGMTTSCFLTTNPDSISVKRPVLSTPTYVGRVLLSGADHVGIVHQVTNIFAKYKWSIDKLETFQEEAPFGGTTLFVMDGIVTATYSSEKISIIQEELHSLADGLNCDISLEDYHHNDETKYVA